MQIADAECPRFGRLLRNLFDGVRTVVHVPAGAGDFDELEVGDGFVQGGCEAAPGFALTLASALRRFLADARGMLAAYGDDPASVRVWACADDLYMQCLPQRWAELTLHCCRPSLRK